MFLDLYEAVCPCIFMEERLGNVRESMLEAI